MLPIQAKHQPKLLESIAILIVFFSIISYFIIVLETVPHIPILLAIFGLILYGLMKKIPFNKLQAGMIEGARSGLGAVFLFFLIGILISSWMISGTIPALIQTGFSLIGGSWFYAIVFVVTALVGVSIGSAFTTIATLGVAFIGMAGAYDASLAITAGAIVSGAFFGDKMSPLSDTTNLASSIVGVDLFEHIKHISLTTIPAFIISLILFGILSPKEAFSAEESTMYLTALSETNLIQWTAWLPLALLAIFSFLKVPAFLTLGVSSILASFVAFFSNGIGWGDIWTVWFEGYTSQSSFGPVADLLSNGGITSMFFTLSLVLLALGFGGLLFVTGVIPSILQVLQEKLKKVRSLIVSTAATAIGVNVFIGEQYLSILLTGETFKSVYEKNGLKKKALSRTLEDAGTVINPLVPWSVSGIFIVSILEVNVLTYLPFAFFCLLSPIITILFGSKTASIQSK